MVILGGMGNVWGVTLGAIVLAYLNYQGLGAIGNNINSGFGIDPHSSLGQHLDPPSNQGIIFGLILVIMMLFRPEGLIPIPAPEDRVPGQGRGRRGRPRRRRLGDRHPMTDLLVARKVRKEFGGLVAVQRRRLQRAGASGSSA